MGNAPEKSTEKIHPKRQYLLLIAQPPWMKDKSTSQDVIIRKATPEDASLLATVGARTFYDAFAAQNNPDDMASYLETAFNAEKMQLELAEASAHFFIAEHAGEAIGYAKIRAIKTPDCIADAHPLELERIYVDQHVVGKGVGAALMKAAIEAGKTQGYQTIWLGVWKENGPAISFYKKWGYAIVGEHEFVVGDDVQHDYIMARPLSA